MTPKIGYFYLIDGFLIGEVVAENDEPHYEGHAAFWEREFAKLFPGSPEILELRLCWYGCDRGRVTCVDGHYILLGTKGVFENREKILQLYGFDDSKHVKKITDDDHYKIITEDAELLNRNLNYFKPPDSYRYLIEENING